MKQLTHNDRTLLCALTDIELELDVVDLSTSQIEKIWGSFKTIRDIIYLDETTEPKAETVTGVIVADKSHIKNKQNETKNLQATT